MSEINWDEKIEAIRDDHPLEALVKDDRGDWLAIDVKMPFGGWNRYPFSRSGECLLIHSGWQLRNVAPSAPADGWEVRATNWTGAGEWWYVQRKLRGQYQWLHRDGEANGNPDLAAVYFPSHFAAAAALAKWREGQREPDPHDPLGDGSVTLWNTYSEGNATATTSWAFVKIDGQRVGRLSDSGFSDESFWIGSDRGEFPRRVWNPAHRNYDFAALRDRIRAERKAKAAEEAKPKPFDAETWPKDAWLRVRGGTIQHRAVAITREGIFTIDYTATKPTDGRVCFISFTAMKDPDGFEMSTDGGLTWHPAYQQEPGKGE
jgi:hypothetical protein